MKKPSFRPVLDVARDVALALLGIASATVNALVRMSLPRLVAVCLVAALILTILPLAVTLFIFALVLKLLVALAVFASRGREPPQIGRNGGRQ